MGTLLVLTLGLTAAVPAQAINHLASGGEPGSTPSSVDLASTTDPETIASLIDEVSSAAQLSEVEILTSTGVTARRATTLLSESGVVGDTWFEGSIDASGNVLIREARALGEPLDQSTYWFDREELALSSINLRNPPTRSAFKLLRDPKVRWVAQTPDNPDEGRDLRRSLTPLYRWTYDISDPRSTRSAERTVNSTGTLYTFEQEYSKYPVRLFTTTVTVDNRGRISLIEMTFKDVSSTATYTYRYTYTSKPIRAPASNTWVSYERFTLAQETVELMRIARILKRGVLQDLKWTLSKESIVESVSRHVEDYNKGDPSSPFRWKSARSGARFWTVSPLDGKNIGARFTLSKTGKLIVRNF